MENASKWLFTKHLEAFKEVPGGFEPPYTVLQTGA